MLVEMMSEVGLAKLMAVKSDCCLFVKVGEGSQIIACITQGATGSLDAWPAPSRSKAEQRPQLRLLQCSCTCSLDCICERDRVVCFV